MQLLPQVLPVLQIRQQLADSVPGFFTPAVALASGETANPTARPRAKRKRRMRTN